MTDDLQERVAVDLDRRLARLHDQFGSFPVEETTIENDPAFFEDGRSLAEDGWRGD